MEQDAENQSTDMSDTHVAKALFNDPDLSDVQFLFDDCVIYAHSWMLLNRSALLQEYQVDLMDDTHSIIKVVDTSYEVFYQFIRFLYTDECDVTSVNKIDMLKLAVRYKVCNLEMKLVNFKSIEIDQHLAMFEYCVVHKYQMTYRSTRHLIQFYLSLVLKCSRFPMIHPDALEEILKFDHVGTGVREIDLFNGLVQWMNFACGQYNIPVDQRRKIFDRFLRLIRFSSMKENELRKCLETNPDLLSNDEAALLTVFGDGTAGRLEYVRPYETRPFFSHWRRKTKFSVSEDVILYALRYGIKFTESAIVLRVTARNLTTDEVDKQQYHFRPSTEIIIMGDVFVIKPNFEYTIDAKYEIEENQFKVFTRRRTENVVVNGPKDLVQVTETSANLIEMFFKNVPL